MTFRGDRGHAPAARRVLALVEALEPDGTGEGADVTPPAAPDESLEDLMARISRVRFRRALWLQARDAARRAAEDPDLPE